MAHKRTDRGDPPPDDPDAIRAAMAETRAALTQKLDALRERVLGPGTPAPNQGEQVMAVKKKARGAAKKGKGGSAAKKSAPTKKAAAKGGGPGKRGGGGGGRPAGKRAPGARAAGPGKAGGAPKPAPAATKAPARKPARKSTGARIAEK